MSTDASSDAPEYDIKHGFRLRPLGEPGETVIALATLEPSGHPELDDTNLDELARGTPKNHRFAAVLVIDELTPSDLDRRSPKWFGRPERVQTVGERHFTQRITSTTWVTERAADALNLQAGDFTAWSVADNDPVWETVVSLGRRDVENPAGAQPTLEAWRTGEFTVMAPAAPLPAPAADGAAFDPPAMAGPGAPAPAAPKRSPASAFSDTATWIAGIAAAVAAVTGLVQSGLTRIGALAVSVALLVIVGGSAARILSARYEHVSALVDHTGTPFSSRRWRHSDRARLGAACLLTVSILGIGLAVWGIVSSSI